MTRSRPAFTLHDDPDSPAPATRSSSRERRHHLSSPISTPRSLPHQSSSYRNGILDNANAGSPGEGAHRDLPDVDEESAVGLSETDSLLNKQPKRRYSLQHSNGGYGATSEDGGAVLSRQESVLRLAGLIDDRGGEYEKFRKSPDELKKLPKRVRRFYERQNEQLDGFKDVDEILENARAKYATGELLSAGQHINEREEDFRASVRWAINLNFIINIVLLAAKIAVVFLSHSMSLVASTVDSAMDFLSTLIIFGTSKYIEQRDWKSQYTWPTGKSRMEPLGVLIFSVAMISSFLQVLIESIQKLVDPALEETHLPPIALATMVATIVIKSGVWLSCRAIKSGSVEALQQDAENDIVFNFFSILFPFFGQMLGWRWLDPVGGALLSIYIIVEWVSTLLDNVRKLTGKRAPPQEHQRIAYLLTRFSPLVTAVQHLSLYYAGEGMLVEVDIVLPADTPLPRAHDVGEAAQYAIEELQGIERAFVHVDVSINDLSGHLQR
ncbi:hypothetical protein JCM8097_004644 [Rhodosporidiobolus ruineniae]